MEDTLEHVALDTGVTLVEMVPLSNHSEVIGNDIKQAVHLSKYPKPRT